MQIIHFLLLNLFLWINLEPWIEILQCSFKSSFLFIKLKFIESGFNRRLYGNIITFTRRKIFFRK